MGTPVAGPGRFSQRTDKAVSEANRSLPNADYGEQAQYQEQLQAAPMAQAPNFSSMFGNPASRVIGFDEGTQMPDTPVTDGAALGPGAGMEGIAPVPENDGVDASYVRFLEYVANRPGSSDAARNAFRDLKYSL